MTSVRLQCALVAALAVAGCGTGAGPKQGVDTLGLEVDRFVGSKIEGHKGLLAATTVDTLTLGTLLGLGAYQASEAAGNTGLLAATAADTLTLGTLLGLDPYQGSKAGELLVRAEQRYTEDAALERLATFPAGQTSHWSNSGAGLDGGFTPSNTYKTADERTIDEHAASDGTYLQLAQFAVPKAAPKGGAAPVTKRRRALEFEYVYGTELEIPYARNLDLNSNLTDDFLIFAPTVFGSVTYRPTDWLETRLEGTLEKLYNGQQKKYLTLPDGSVERAAPNRWSLLIDQLYLKFMHPTAPVDFTIGRRVFEDHRLWLLDGELDAAIVTIAPGDFKIEASMSREDLVDLDLMKHVPKGRIDNYIVTGEYRGIEDHKLAAYWIKRKDRSGQEGSPQFYGLRAYGTPADEFKYWSDIGFVGGKDAFSRDFRGYAFEVGGTYRFLNLPLQPSITAGYAFGSGDDNPDDNTNHAYRQTGLQSNETRFGGPTQFLAYGEVLDPELSNIKIFTLGAGIRPAAGVFVDLVYHRYRLRRLAQELRGTSLTAQINQVESRMSKDLGSALDLILGFRNLFGVRGLGVDVRAGMFFPGDAFLRDDGGGRFSDADKGISVLGAIFF